MTSPFLKKLISARKLKSDLQRLDEGLAKAEKYLDSLQPTTGAGGGTGPEIPAGSAAVEVANMYAGGTKGTPVAATTVPADDVIAALKALGAVSENQKPGP